eukprot:11950060-Ditylum_brightwellii.AAC.1
MTQPSTLGGCGHTFCSSCINFYSGKHDICPLPGCGIPLSLNSGGNKFVKINPQLNSVVSSLSCILNVLGRAETQWWKDPKKKEGEEEQEEEEMVDLQSSSPREEDELQNDSSECNHDNHTTTTTTTTAGEEHSLPGMVAPFVTSRQLKKRKATNKALAKLLQEDEDDGTCPKENDDTKPNAKIMSSTTVAFQRKDDIINENSTNYVDDQKENEESDVDDKSTQELPEPSEDTYQGIVILDSQYDDEHEFSSAYELSQLAPQDEEEEEEEEKDSEHTAASKEDERTKTYKNKNDQEEETNRKDSMHSSLEKKKRTSPSFVNTTISTSTTVNTTPKTANTANNHKTSFTFDNSPNLSPVLKSTSQDSTVKIDATFHSTPSPSFKLNNSCGSLACQKEKISQEELQPYVMILPQPVFSLLDGTAYPNAFTTQDNDDDNKEDVSMNHSPSVPSFQ